MVRIQEPGALARLKEQLEKLVQVELSESQVVTAALGTLLIKLEGGLIPRDVAEAMGRRMCADVLEQFIRDCYKRGELDQDFAIAVDVDGKPGIQVAHGDVAREFTANPPDLGITLN